MALLTSERDDETGAQVALEKTGAAGAEEAGAVADQGRVRVPRACNSPCLRTGNRAFFDSSSLTPRARPRVKLVSEPYCGREGSNRVAAGRKTPKNFVLPSSSPSPPRSRPCSAPWRDRTLAPRHPTPRARWCAWSRGARPSSSWQSRCRRCPRSRVSYRWSRHSRRQARRGRRRTRSCQRGRSARSGLRAAWRPRPGRRGRRRRSERGQSVSWSAGTRATARSGPPDPPAIFMGSAITQAPVSGSSSRRVRFSRPGRLAAAATTWWTAKSADGPWSMLAVSTPRAATRRATSSSAASRP